MRRSVQDRSCTAMRDTRTMAHWRPPAPGSCRRMVAVAPTCIKEKRGQEASMVLDVNI